MATGAQGIRAGRAYVEIGTYDKYIAGLRRAQRRLRAFGAAVGAIGAKMMRVGAMMAAPFALGAKGFATFDQQMRMVSTMLGDAAGKWMPLFSQAAKDMSIEFGQSIDSISKGMYDLLSAQVAPAEMLGVLRVAMKAAAGGFTDTATAVKALVRIMRGFGIEARYAQDISDVLFTIVEKGVITYEELAESIGTVAPTAKAAGLGLEQLAAAVATVVAVEEPKRAMTALRTAIYEAAEAGIDLLAFARKFEGADLGAVIAAGIPKKAAQGIVILAQNIKLLDSNLAAMANRAGAAQSAYDKMAAGLMHSWNQIWSAAKVVFIEIGAAIEEPLAAAGEAAKKWTKNITEWTKRNRGLLRTVVKIITLVFVTGAALVAFSLVVKAVSFAIGGLLVVLALAKAAFLAFGAVFTFILSPIGMVIVAVGALAAYLAVATKAGGKALDWLGGKFTKLKNWAIDMWKGISDALAAGDLALAAKVAWLGLKLAWLEGTRGLRNYWEHLMVAMQVGFWRASKFIANQWLRMVLDLKWAWSGFAGWMKRAWETQATYIVGAVVIATGGTWAEAEAAMAFAEKTHDTRIRQISKETRKRRLAALADFRDGKKRIDENHERELAAISRVRAANTDATKEEIKQAREKLKKAMEEAAKRRKRYEADRDEGPEGPPDPQAIIDRIKKEARESTKAAAQAVSVMGGFGARALWGMGGGAKAADRTAAATEKTAKLTKQLLTVEQAGRLVFTR